MGLATDVLKLHESGLSRVMQHINEHETGAMTAFRGSFSKSQNQARNHKLKAQLMSKGYGLTSIKGTYIENFNTPEAKEVGEETFFVVDLKDGGKLREDLEKFGREYDQDSILIIPKGGKGAYLVGTNNAAFPGLGNEHKTGDRNMGQAGEFTSKVKGRPFIFKEDFEEHIQPTNNMGKWSMSLAAKKELT